MTNHSLEFYDQDFESNKEKIFDDFFHYLRFKSISTQPTFKSEILACANWLEKYLEDLDFKVDIWQTPGHPTLFAQNLKAGPTKPTLLIYLHYDVQPVDPINLWQTPPFEPTIRNNKIYARGACDNKGQAFYTITALKAILKKHSHYPVNLKILIEGEEESGSKGLQKIIKSKKSEVAADYLLIVDTNIPSEDSPTVNLGCRGISTAEITLQGSTTDLHSGLYGGVAYNPIRALCEIFSEFYDRTGKVTIPGFYDSIRKLSPKQKKELYLDFDGKAFEKEVGAKAIGGERRLPPQERIGLRPTFEINGIWGGYTEEGFKTVIPALAHAKVSMRLVPDQDPAKIFKQFEEHLRSLVPDGFKLTVTKLHDPAPAFWGDFDSKIAEISAWAFTTVFKKKCKKYMGGGSLPIAHLLQKVSKTDAVGIGVGLSSDLIHAPNEHFSIDRFKKGYLVITQLLEKLGEE